MWSQINTLRISRPILFRIFLHCFTCVLLVYIIVNVSCQIWILTWFGNWSSTCHVSYLAIATKKLNLVTYHSYCVSHSQLIWELEKKTLRWRTPYHRAPQTRRLWTTEPSLTFVMTRSGEGRAILETRSLWRTEHVSDRVPSTHNLDGVGYSR